MAAAMCQPFDVFDLGACEPPTFVAIPDAKWVHLFIARGGVSLEGAGALVEGDAVRLTAAGELTLTADPDSGAEVLVWQMG